MRAPNQDPTPRPGANPAATTPSPASVGDPLQAQVNALAQQLAGLKAQRTVLDRQIRRLPSNALRANLEVQRVNLENEIVQTDLRLADARAQLGIEQGGPVTGTITPPPGPPPPPGRQFDPDLVIGLFFAFIFAVLMPISIAFARRIWRGKPKDLAPRVDETAPRLERLEHGLDAIAIEIERISEGQRFVTRVLAERPAAAPSPAQAPARNEAAARDAAGLGDAKPFLALGAGPIEPIRVAERQSVRQSITPH